jgi:hypothetical protein
MKLDRCIVVRPEFNIQPRELRDRVRCLEIGNSSLKASCRIGSKLAAAPGILFAGPAKAFGCEAQFQQSSPCKPAKVESALLFTLTFTAQRARRHPLLVVFRLVQPQAEQRVITWSLAPAAEHGRRCSSNCRAATTRFACAGGPHGSTPQPPFDNPRSPL